MFLFGDGNKGFLLFRDWTPLGERLRGELVRLKSKITRSVTRTSAISNAKVQSKITVNITRNSNLALSFIKIKSKLKELIQLKSKITSKVSLDSTLTTSKYIKSLVKVKKSLISRIIGVYYIITKVKKDGQ